MSEYPTPTEGFLAHLIEGVRMREPYLQRRQPSLFEAVQPGSEAQLDDGSSDERGSHAAPAGNHPADVPMRATGRLEAVTARVAASGSAAASSPDRGGVRETVQRDASRSPAEGAARSELRVVHETLHVDSSVRIVQHLAAPASRGLAESAAPPAVAAAARAQPASNPREATPEEGRRATRAASTPSAARARTNAPATERPIPARRIEAIDFARPAAARAPIVSAPVAPSRAAVRSAAMRAPLAAAPAPAALPPVQVTIGRVEVRAVPQPAASGRSPRTGPRLSLEQYLRDRHGGGR